MPELNSKDPHSIECGFYTRPKLFSSTSSCNRNSSSIVIVVSNQTGMQSKTVCFELLCVSELSPEYIANDYDCMPFFAVQAAAAAPDDDYLPRVYSCCLRGGSSR